MFSYKGKIVDIIGSSWESVFFCTECNV